MSNPPAGWYPAPHANNEQRYWDGSQWAETTPAVDASSPSTASSTKTAKGLALAALIVGIIGFLCGLLPFVGTVVGAAAVVLGIVALVRRQSKGLAITGMILGAIGFITSIVMSVSFATFMINQPQADPAPAPAQTTETEPDPEPTEDEPEVEPDVESTPDAPAEDPSTPDLSTFKKIDDRDYALIAKDPDAHIGTNFVIYGSIMQFDAATGRCAMLISTSASRQEMSFEYDQNVMAVSGDWESECPVFDPLVEDDHLKIWATVVQSFSYDTQIGGNTTVPMIEVWKAQILPATEY